MSVSTRSIRVIRVTIIAIVSFVAIIVPLIYNIDLHKADNKDIITVSFNDKESISGFWLNDTVYLVLPSYAKIGELKVKEDQSCAFLITYNNTILDLSRLQIGKIYNLEINGLNKFISIRQSKCIPSLIINTQSGGNNIIHQTKLYGELISIKLLMPDGTTLYESSCDTIQSRGNTSWTAEKKPYMLMLNNPASLLDMNLASKWILLASPYDETNIRNKVVYDFCENVGFEWSPSCEFVELFLNNEYRGLYLLTEKIEMSDTRLKPKNNSLNFLCTMDLVSRCQNKKNKEIITTVGQGIRIRYPYFCSYSEYNFIDSLINLFDVALMKSDTSQTFSTEWTKLADIDSWARRYLVDEIFGNFDAGLASNFFYCHTDKDGEYRLYGGPIWDYDGSLNTNEVLPNPNSFLVRRSWRSASVNARTPWYNAMYKSPEFNKRVRELYFQEFRPHLLALVNQDSLSYISNKYSQYADAITSNNIRWYESLHSTYVQSFGVKTIPDVLHYMQEKISFLDAAWSDNSEYCLVQIETVHNGEYACFSVKKGDPFKVPFDTLNYYWVNKDSNEILTDTTSINKDVQLLIRNKNNVAIQSSKVKNNSTLIPSIDDRLIILGFSMLLFVLLSCYMAIRYYKNK